MEFRDLKKQYQVLKKDIDASVQNVLNNTNFISGKEVIELEGILANYVGVKHCITCANGTDALTMSLMSLDIKENDAVFVPTFTFFASAEVVALKKATPVFVDIDEYTFNIDPIDLEKRVNQVIKEGILNPKLIITVDLFGLPANYTEIERIAKKYDLLILEDGAQGFGGMLNNKKACSFGNIATTSFFPAKPLGCYGDGGAIFTNDDDIADYLKSIRVHGKGLDKYDNVRIGLNSRLDTLQAALLQVKFKAFIDYELDAVNKVYEMYNKRLKDYVTIPFIPENYYSSFAQYSILLKTKEEREKVQKHLKENGIPTMIYYVKPMHLQKAFGFLDYKMGDFRVSEKLSDIILQLPMHPYLTEYEIDIICSKIIEVL